MVCDYTVKCETNSYYTTTTLLDHIQCNETSHHIIWLSLYVPISWIISQLNAPGKNWFPLLQTTSLMRVSFRAPADTNTHHQTQRKYNECSNTHATTRLRVCKKTVTRTKVRYHQRAAVCVCQGQGPEL